MKILFVKPHWRWCRTQYGAPPLGLMLLSSQVKKTIPGVETRLVDLRLLSKPYIGFKKILSEYQPDIIAVMALAGDEDVLAKLSETAKAINPAVHICCGGPLPTICPELFPAFTNIDSIIRGEGEFVFCDLITLLKSSEQKPSEPIQGLAVRSREGHLSIPDKSLPVKNLDDLPFPDWELIDIERYSEIVQMNGVLAGKRYMPIFTSRGCPYSCSFCHNLFGTNTRFRSAENIVEEIKILVTKYQVDEIQIFDDIFNLNRDRLIKICDLILKEKLNIHIAFPNGLRGDRLDDEMIIRLKQAGTYMITFAFESASDRIQKLINKNLDIDKTMKAVKFANSQGLITKSFFMVGFPGESHSEIMQTLNFAVKSPLTTLVIFSVVPFKGTKIYDLAKQTSSPAAETVLNNPFASYFSSKTFYTETTGLNLKKLINIAYLRFFTPVRLLRFFMKIPRKKLYLSHLKTVLSVLFIHKRSE